MPLTSRPRREQKQSEVDGLSAASTFSTKFSFLRFFFPSSTHCHVYFHLAVCCCHVRLVMCHSWTLHTVKKENFTFSQLLARTYFIGLFPGPLYEVLAPYFRDSISSSFIYCAMPDHRDLRLSFPVYLARILTTPPDSFLVAAILQLVNNPYSCLMSGVKETSEKFIPF